MKMDVVFGLSGFSVQPLTPFAKALDLSAPMDHNFAMPVPEPVRPSEEITCDVCGRYGAYAFEGRSLCADCCATAGSCGPGGDESDKREDAKDG